MIGMHSAHSKAQTDKLDIAGTCIRHTANTQQRCQYSVKQIQARDISPKQTDVAANS